MPEQTTTPGLYRTHHEAEQGCSKGSHVADRTTKQATQNSNTWIGRQYVELTGAFSRVSSTTIISYGIDGKLKFTYNTAKVSL